MKNQSESWKTLGKVLEICSEKRYEPWYNRVAEKLSHQSSIIEGLKNDIHESRKTANEAAKQAEELSQYIRRDWLEIAGIAPNEELTC